MDNKLNVSSSPHVRSKDSTSTIMRDVVIAMVPATLFGLYNAFANMGASAGINSILVIVFTVGFAILAEYVYEKCMKLPITIGDYSAAVTGLILALNMPQTIAPWIPALGAVFAIIVVKMLFGGLGQNFMNPALAARCFLLISFAGPMTKFFNSATTFAGDAVSGATPLGLLKNGGLDALTAEYSIGQLFIGNIPGTIGETSVIALLLGAAYLLYKHVIDWKIPVIYIGTVAVFALVFGGFVDGVGFFNFEYMLAMVGGGGLVFGAFFMATDYVTSPITPNGQIVFGVCLGVLTGLFRMFGGSAEGVSYAIIFCNLLVPLIERFTMPTPFGLGKENK